jgi:sulfur carrier protein
VNVILNGETADLGPDATVADAVARAGVEEPARGVAVAVDGEVVPRAEWGGRPLLEGESVEVVHAVQGG